MQENVTGKKGVKYNENENEGIKREGFHLKSSLI